MLWLLLSAAGAVLLALPDDGARLVAFSGAHGLTAIDAIAVGLLLAGWLPIAAFGWKRRAAIAAGVELPARRAAVFLSGLGAGLLVASVFGDFEGWWAVGAVILAGVQVAALASLGRA